MFLEETFPKNFSKLKSKSFLLGWYAITTESVFLLHARTVLQLSMLEQYVYLNKNDTTVRKNSLHFVFSLKQEDQ